MKYIAPLGHIDLVENNNTHALPASAKDIDIAALLEGEEKQGGELEKEEEGERYGEGDGERCRKRFHSCFLFRLATIQAHVKTSACGPRTKRKSPPSTDE